MHTLGTKILIVDDEMTNRMILASFMEGCDVTECESGLDALKKIEENPDGYGVVVTDKRMPGMDGIELASKVMSDKKTSDMEFIMLTGDFSKNEITRGIGNGIYYYLKKPFDEEVLMTFVRSAIDENARKKMFRQNLINAKSSAALLKREHYVVFSPLEAQELSVHLGCVFTDPVTAAMGLYELMLNAIEHGNLKIGRAKKAELLMANDWEREVDRRLTSPENAGKAVSIIFEDLPERFEITITDEGEGFDWQKYLILDPERALEVNGRGIARVISHKFGEIQYRGAGNKVKIISHKSR